MEPVCCKYFQLSTVAVQIQPAGKKTVGTCLLHVKYFQFSTATVQIQLGGKKTVGTCFLHVKYFQQQLYSWNLFVAWFSAVAVQIQLGGQKTVGTCLLHVKYFQFSTAAVRSQLAGKKNGWNLFVARPASFQSLQSCRCPCCAGFLLLWGVLGAAVAGPSQSLSCMAEKSIYIYLSLCPLPLPHPSLPPPSAPPSPYVYIICWSSLRNRNAHGSLCFGSTMWEYTGASSNSSADHFSMIISVCRNYHQGAKIQVRVPVTGRPFFNDKVGMPYLRRGCRIYVEGVVTRSTVSDAGVGGSGYVLRQWLSNYLRVQRAVITILKIIPWAHVTTQMQNC